MSEHRTGHSSGRQRGKQQWNRLDVFRPFIVYTQFTAPNQQNKQGCSLDVYIILPRIPSGILSVKVLHRVPQKNLTVFKMK
jgi:hypothetical protein